MRMLLNFFRLSQVALPFSRIYFHHRLLARKKGPFYQFWLKICGRIPALAEVEGPLRRRMWHYLFANSMTAFWFSVLRGRKLSQPEREAGWMLGIATPLADYLVDHDHLEFKEIKKMIDGDSNHPLANLVRALHVECRRLNLHPELFDRYLDKTQWAQSRSLAQNQTTSSSETLIRIMYDKGGFALLLYRTALLEKLTPAEEEAIFSLGGLMQFHNDIFDIYRDQSEGIHTLPGSLISHHELSKFYGEHREKTFSHIAALPFARDNKHRFFLLANLALETGQICLDMYATLDDSADAVFDPSQHRRSELVCDMDNLPNIARTVLRTLRQTYRL